MNNDNLKNRVNLKDYLKDSKLKHYNSFLYDLDHKTEVELIEIDNKIYPKFINEYWTSRQRQASSLHEIAYRACFKAQLPRFFITLLTKQKDRVYDPFSGRGTTVIEAALLGRKIISNDINPLSKILSQPRINILNINLLENRLNQISIKENAQADLDLSMFFHPKTEAEIVSLKDYLKERKISGKEDYIDKWIRMIATNRLTGHSPGFFSVYTLPPNQAVSPERQRKINEKRNQKPTYKKTHDLIVRKYKSLVKDVTDEHIKQLKAIKKSALFFTKDARKTFEIEDNTVQLTVTSPPFLDIVQYTSDNWLRFWFNSINVKELESNITMSRTLEQWSQVMTDVFKELYRITKKGGWIAFEVGEVKGGKVKLDEHVIPSGISAGFICEGIMVNQQFFTKTSNIWGVKNNSKGTNTNRIVIFHKD
jgi:DNA modification methylase